MIIAILKIDDIIVIISTSKNSEYIELF